MQTLARLTFAVLLFAAIAGISGCGRISAPSTIEGSGYPHSYPRQ